MYVCTRSDLVLTTACVCLFVLFVCFVVLLLLLLLLFNPIPAGGILTRAHVDLCVCVCVCVRAPILTTRALSIRRHPAPVRRGGRAPHVLPRGR